jgi:hypothetical protein
LEVEGFFDEKYSFDFYDAQTRGWKYRPLFYVDELIEKKKERKYDLLYICSLHTKRAYILNNLKKFASENHYSLRAFMFMKRIFYYKYKYINKRPEIVMCDNQDMIFKPIDIEKSYELYSDSRIIVDYSNPEQTGFTMRTIEGIGNNCKLVTNNELIKKADFYNEHNIYIYDENDFTIPKSFIEEPYYPLAEEVYKRYSLDQWVEDIFGDSL